MNNMSAKPQPTWQSKAIAALKSDPKKTGVMSVLAVVVMLLTLRMVRMRMSMSMVPMVMMSSARPTTTSLRARPQTDA